MKLIDRAEPCDVLIVTCPNCGEKVTIMCAAPDCQENTKCNKCRKGFSLKGLAREVITL